MGILEILTFPDPRLREVSKAVTKFDDSIKQLAADMVETMYAAKGIGLAAPQVGQLFRMLVVDTRPRDESGSRYNYEEMTELEKKITQPLVIINPVIIKGDGKTTFDEGCLSVPGFYETVERFEKIQLQYQDVNGNKHVLETDGLLAICLQHEMDHLEGKLFIDHISFMKSKKIKDQIKKFGYPTKDDKDDEKENTKKEKVEA
ncbi:MAG: peptide deformylase [Bdellovibrionota bacterium]